MSGLQRLQLTVFKLFVSQMFIYRHREYKSVLPAYFEIKYSLFFQQQQQ